MKPVKIEKKDFSWSESSFTKSFGIRYNLVDAENARAIALMFKTKKEAKKWATENGYEVVE